MKKLLTVLMALVMALSMITIASAEETYSVAMITDYGDITDQSFNQTTYEACVEFCEANGLNVNYYKPVSDADAERVAKIEQAIDEGYNVIVMPGYAFAAAIAEVAGSGDYDDIAFIGLDVSEGDLTGAGLTEIPANVYCAVYQEELCGYMAGYAAAKMGYEHLGFLGGMAVPAVQRYGYGFVQGVDAAAAELGKDNVTVEYVYGNQFYGDADITAYMDNWYQNLGVQVVFACGGGIYTSAAEAAVKVEGSKVIGVDVDQSFTIDGLYGEGLTITSAMKGLAATVKTILTETVNGNFAAFGGKIENLGIVSENAEENYVGIPTATTAFCDAFTVEDYNAMVSAMFNGSLTVSNDITVEPAANASTVTVNAYGNIK